MTTQPTIRSVVHWVCAAAIALGSGGCSSCVSITPVTLPREVVPVLTFGLPLGILDTSILKSIDGGSPATHVKIAVEFEHAPALTMIRLPPSLTATLPTFINAIHVVVPDVIPPVENDNVFCKRDAYGGIVQPGDAGFELPTFDATLFPAALVAVPGTWIASPAGHTIAEARISA